MPHYYFHLRDGAAGARDTEGTEFSDHVVARTHAMHVARELMSRAEAERRHWQLDVCDDAGGLLFHLPFSVVDSTIDHLDAQTRQVVERLCQTRGELAEAVFKATIQARARPIAEAWAVP